MFIHILQVSRWDTCQWVSHNNARVLEGLRRLMRPAPGPGPQPHGLGFRVKGSGFRVYLAPSPPLSICHAMDFTILAGMLRPRRKSLL
jgi:hypothetical protein